MNKNYIEINKNYAELYRFCELALKFEKDDQQAKVISFGDYIYYLGQTEALRICRKRDDGLFEYMLFERPGYYIISKRASNKFIFTLRDHIEPNVLNEYVFEEMDRIRYVNNIIDTCYSDGLCEFTKTSEFKISTVVDKLGIWIKDDDLAYLKAFNYLECFKHEYMLVCHNVSEVKAGEVIHTHMILNFNNKKNIYQQQPEQQEMSLDESTLIEEHEIIEPEREFPRTLGNNTIVEAEFHEKEVDETNSDLLNDDPTF